MENNIITMETLIRRAFIYASECHTKVNHRYDNKPYIVHLKQVFDIGTRFIHLIPLDKRDVVLASCWTHDMIEDTRQSYNDIKGHLNEEIANITFAVTNDKGKTRSERAGDNYYRGIRETEFATFVKLCDRIANILYSKEHKSKMFEIYKKENQKFISSLYDERYQDLFDYLNSIFINEK